MRIAVFSDVHSNVYALDAVLGDLSHKTVDRIVSLGDALIGPVDPVGTAACMMKLPNLINIMGNGDEMLLQDIVRSESYDFTRPLLNEKIMEWLRTFKPQWIYEDILFIHGSPHSNHAYLMEEVGPEGIRQKSMEQIDQDVSSVSQHCIICGHSHLHKSIITPKGKLILNPGSVGLPAYSDEKPYPHNVENFTPYAKYMIITVENKKETHI